MESEWETLGWTMKFISRHSQGLKMATVSSGATGKARCFSPWNLVFAK